MGEGMDMAYVFLRLDDETKAVCAAWFGMMLPGHGRLVFGMKERKPSTRAQAALDKLGAEGIVRREDGKNGEVAYVPVIDCSPLVDWFANVHGEERFKFSLTEKIMPSAREGFTMTVQDGLSGIAAAVAAQVGNPEEDPDA